MSCGRVGRQTSILQMRTTFLLNLHYLEDYFFENVYEPILI